MCNCHPPDSPRVNRRRALVGLAAGALALCAVGGSSPVGAESAAGPLNDSGSALVPARRMGRRRREFALPPPGKLILPVEPKTNLYVLDNFGDCRGHEGVDIMAAGGGNEVYAVANGQLTKWYSNTGTAGWGWTLYVADTKTTYKYFHIADNKNGWSVGSQVRMGDVLGFVGSSGTDSASNFHLHFEVRPNNVPVDPLPLLDIPRGVPIGPPQPSC